jgi:hypothetical protein
VFSRTTRSTLRRAAIADTVITFIAAMAVLAVAGCALVTLAGY